MSPHETAGRYGAGVVGDAEPGPADVVGTVVGVPDLLGTGKAVVAPGVDVTVVGGSGPGPSGSTTVVAVASDGEGAVVDGVSPGEASVGLGSVVVVAVVGVVVLGR